MPGAVPHVDIVEIKARCSSLEAVRGRLETHGARYVGEDHQVDTYYVVPEGRLKLRRGTIEEHLIFYRRPNQASPKPSDVWLYAPAESEGLGNLLGQALEVRGVVEKRRQIFFLDNVKVHLDRVEGLGTFVEVEAIGQDGSRALDGLRAQCEATMEMLGVEADRLERVSYSDMLLADGAS